MNSGIDFLRHLFAIAVIAQHMSSNTRYSIATNLQLLKAVDWIDGAVIGFFMISGYLFVAPQNILAYWRKQGVRLMGPFFIFSIVYAVALAALGKASVVEGLLKTVTLQGAGMQLYYLPFLFLVTVVYATFERTLRLETGLVALFLAVLASGTAFMLPTVSSTGSDSKLLPLYVAAFLIGRFFAERKKSGPIFGSLLTVVGGALVLGFQDARFFDFAGVVVLFGAVISLAPILPNSRLPGSGGIYLLHTPVTNFAVSTLLVAFSVTQGLNIVASIVITYILCLSMTLFFVKLFPKFRWLLLE